MIYTITWARENVFFFFFLRLSVSERKVHAPKESLRSCTAIKWRSSSKGRRSKKKTPTVIRLSNKRKSSDIPWRQSAHRWKRKRFCFELCPSPTRFPAYLWELIPFCKLICSSFLCVCVCVWMNLETGNLHKRDNLLYLYILMTFGV